MKIYAFVLALMLAFVSGAALAGWPPAAEIFARHAETVLDGGGDDAPSRAAALFREALARDQASPYRWCSLGESLAETDADSASFSFRRAVELGPNVPPVLMRAANFWLARGDTASGLACGRRILALARDYDAVVFSTYARMGVADALVRKSGLPESAAARRAYLRYLVAAGSAEDAARTWSWLDGLGQTDRLTAAEYCEFLLARREYQRAAEVWRPGRWHLDAVSNGGFEEEPAGRALDWMTESVEGVAVSRERAPHSGKFSLRLAFEPRSNLLYRGVAQNVVARPGVYRLRAFVRAEGLTTDQGIRFRIVDPRDPGRVNLTTAQITGTTAWTEAGATVAIPPPARLLRLEVLRQPSLKFDNQLAGTVWIDDVELVPAAGRGPEPLIQ